MPEDFPLSLREDGPPVVLRRVPARRRHHGGAWKVAFADFVTALMALFLVLWLSQADLESRRAVAAYFDDPRGSLTALAGRGGESVVLSGDQLTALSERIRRSMRAMPDFADLEAHVALSVEPEGLRIELLEDDTGLFFSSGAAAPSARGVRTLTLIGRQLAQSGGKLVVEGHTDARPYRGREGYSNWELSTERANAARRLLIEAGVAAERIDQVRGFASGRPRDPGRPEDASNRRVSIVALYD